MSESTDLIQVRPARPGDMALIYRTWLEELRHSDASPLPDELFFPAYREYLNRVLSDTKTQVRVLTSPQLPEDKDILGYIVAEPPETETKSTGHIQWLFLKPQYRGKHLKLVQLLLSSLNVQRSPLLWRTTHSRKLTNPMRSRQFRNLYRTPTPVASLSTISPVDVFR